MVALSECFNLSLSAVAATGQVVFVLLLQLRCLCSIIICVKPEEGIHVFRHCQHPLHNERSLRLRLSHIVAHPCIWCVCVCVCVLRGTNVCAAHTSTHTHTYTWMPAPGPSLDHLALLPRIKVSHSVFEQARGGKGHIVEMHHRLRLSALLEGQVRGLI